MKPVLLYCLHSNGRRQKILRAVCQMVGSSRGKNKAENSQVCYRKEKKWTSLIKRSERFEGGETHCIDLEETACLALFSFSLAMFPAFGTSVLRPGWNPGPGESTAC